MMERIGTHLSYLIEYSKATFQDSEKLQMVRCGIQCSCFLIKATHTFYQALAAAYCDLLEFYIKARQVFSNKKGKPSCKCILEDDLYISFLSFLTYSTLDVQGFKLFSKLAWEPFETQFNSIEENFSNHALTIIRLANIDYQIRTLEYQRREGEYNYII